MVVIVIKGLLECLLSPIYPIPLSKPPCPSIYNSKSTVFSLQYLITNYPCGNFF
jgi:hypothetical protein